MFVFISDDGMRPLYRFQEVQLRHLTRTGPCEEPEKLWFSADEGDDAAVLEARTRERAAARWANLPTWRRTALHADAVLKRNPYVFALVRNFAALAIQPIFAESEDVERLFEKSQQAFEVIVEGIDRRKIGFVHILQKDEVVAGRPGPLSVRVVDGLQSMGFDVPSCAIPADELHQYDGHPTADSYRRLANCVSKQVAQLDAQ